MASTSVDFGVLLGFAYKAFVDQLRAQLAAQGFDDLGAAYGYVFRALAADTLQLNELASRLEMTAQGALKIINEMETRGYVERRPDPEDGRAKQLRLTPRGRAALAAARRFHAVYEKRLRSMVGERDVSAARRMFESMLAEADIDVATAKLGAI
ncbi:MAG: helix-turn-helix domain-containing protein [Deltaproteobacteria bacterium]